AVGDTLPAAGHNAVLYGKLVLGYAEPLRSQFEQRLINIGGGFSDVRHPALEKIERSAAIGRAVRVPCYDRGDGFERDPEFVRRNLPVGGEHAACAEVGLAGANQD